MCLFFEMDAGQNSTSTGTLNIKPTWYGLKYECKGLPFLFSKVKKRRRALLKLPNIKQGVLPDVPQANSEKTIKEPVPEPPTPRRRSPAPERVLHFVYVAFELAYSFENGTICCLHMCV